MVNIFNSSLRCAAFTQARKAQDSWLKFITHQFLPVCRRRLCPKFRHLDSLNIVNFNFCFILFSLLCNHAILRKYFHFFSMVFSLHFFATTPYLENIFQVLAIVFFSSLLCNYAILRKYSPSSCNILNTSDEIKFLRSPQL